MILLCQYYIDNGSMRLNDGNHTLEILPYAGVEFVTHATLNQLNVVTLSDG